MTTESLARHMYTKECEDCANEHINTELKAFYCALSIATFFSHDNCPMPGIVAFARMKAKNYRERACRIMAYQVLRGAHVDLKSIEPPAQQTFKSYIEAFECCVKIAKTVDEGLHKWYDCAQKCKDAHLMHFIQDKLMDELLISIKASADCLSNLRMVGDGLGVWLFDRWLQKEVCQAKACHPPTHVSSDIAKFMPNPLFQPHFEHILKD